MDEKTIFMILDYLKLLLMGDQRKLFLREIPYYCTLVLPFFKNKIILTFFREIPGPFVFIY